MEKNLKTEYHYPSRQRPNLLAQLDEMITMRESDDDTSRAIAFRNVVLDEFALYPGKERIRTDGAGDRGIDFYSIDQNKIDIFQVKAKEEFCADSYSSKMGVAAIPDIHRIISYLKSADGVKKKQNQGIANFQTKVLDILKKQKDGFLNTDDETTPDIEISISLIISTPQLTEQAQEEFEEIKKDSVVIEIRGQECLVSIELITIDEVLGKIWADSNTDWRTRSGNKSENMIVNTHGQLLKLDSNVFIFFAHASDLVSGYHEFGHRLLDANVRCQITRSKVNERIKGQVATEKGIKEFHKLNNGVTIVAEQITTNNNNTKITFTKPGIVNGLQTVTTLSDAYQKLKAELKGVFDEKCYVLVKAYKNKAINDINKLVLATNNQNVMESRNLRSNEALQKVLETNFAKEGWFYERKSHAWAAFRSDPKSWVTANNEKMRKSDFQSADNKTTRRADNVEIAQAWLAFIGLSNLAMDEKKSIFEDDNKLSLYELAFERRPKRHAADIGFDRGKMQEESSADAPNHQSLLFSFLLWKLYKNITPTNVKHREALIKKLRLEGKSQEEKQSALLKSKEYQIGSVMNTAHLIFVEMAGFVLFKKYGEKIYDKIPVLLNKSDLSDYKVSYNPEKIFKALENKRFNEKSLFITLYEMFKFQITELVETPSWRDGYIEATSRSRYIYHANTRTKLIERIKEFDDMLATRGLARTWSPQFDKHKSLYKGIFIE